MPAAACSAASTSSSTSTVQVFAAARAAAQAETTATPGVDAVLRHLGRTGAYETSVADSVRLGAALDALDDDDDPLALAEARAAAGDAEGSERILTHAAQVEARAAEIRHYEPLRGRPVAATSAAEEYEEMAAQADAAGQTARALLYLKLAADESPSAEDLAAIERNDPEDPDAQVLTAVLAAAGREGWRQFAERRNRPAPAFRYGLDAEDRMLLSAAGYRPPRCPR